MFGLWLIFVVSDNLFQIAFEILHVGDLATDTHLKVFLATFAESFHLRETGVLPLFLTHILLADSVFLRTIVCLAPSDCSDRERQHLKNKETAITRTIFKNLKNG